MKCEFFDGNVLLCLDAPASVTRGNDVECSLAGEQQLVLCPDCGCLMVGRVVAGSDGQRVLRALGSHHLHLFLVLQAEWSPLLAGQRQAVEFHFGLTDSLQDELSVVAFACQSEGELVLFVQALDVYIGTVDGHVHTVFCLLFHFCCLAIIADGNVFCMRHTAYKQER